MQPWRGFSQQNTRKRTQYQLGQKNRPQHPRRKKNKSDWVPDPLYEAVEKAMPHESELTIEANRYVEADLMPIFASGMPVDIVQEQHTNKWNADIQDSG